jgi:hypothetical protein
MGNRTGLNGAWSLLQCIRMPMAFRDRGCRDYSRLMSGMFPRGKKGNTFGERLGLTHIRSCFIPYRIVKTLFRGCGNPDCLEP